MKHFTGYGSYLLFLALRTHFTNAKYDFFQMHGKLRATKESYQKRNDRFFFEKLAKQYDAEELKDFYIANFLNDKRYVTDLLDEDAHAAFFNHRARQQAIQYHFRNDLDLLFDKGVKQVFQLSEDEYPKVIILYFQGRISIDTLVILNDFIPFADKFSKYLSEDVVWNKIALKMQKYRPFLKYPRDKIKLILKESIDENSRGQRI